MLQLKNITFDLPDSKSILHNFSFDFEAQKIYALTGANGSGKSTLAEIIMSIKQPTSGKIIFDNQDITHQNISERAKLGFSLSFQNPLTFKGITVTELLNIATHEKLAKDTLCNLLDRVGLCYQDYAHRELNKDLSGGELKRIELATALARNTQFNIFDEPEAGIDLWSFNQLVDIFTQLKATQKTSLIITHQEKILKLADEILLLQKGQLVQTGSFAQLASQLAVFDKCQGCPKEKK